MYCTYICMHEYINVYVYIYIYNIIYNIYIFIYLSIYFIYIYIYIYPENKLMKLAEFLHADTNLGMLNVSLIIIGWGHPKMAKIF